MIRTFPTLAAAFLLVGCAVCPEGQSASADGECWDEATFEDDDLYLEDDPGAVVGRIELACHGLAPEVCELTTSHSRCDPTEEPCVSLQSTVSKLDRSHPPLQVTCGNL